jgi:ABC-type dipeptide/oligopeptide/nickel transport system permease component
MTTYILRRLLFAIPVLIGASFLVFASIRMVPGDPAIAIAGELATPELREQVRKDLRLDDPLLIQYGVYLQRMLKGDMGQSVRTRLPVWDEIILRLPNTLRLAILSLILAAVIGIPIGVISATRANTWVDGGSMVFALLGVSMPVFWLGLMLIVLFAVTLPRWLGLDGPILPPTGTGTWKHYIMPVITLAANSMAIQARMTRACMLEVLRTDYIRTARAKGLAEWKVIYKHALRNALVPIVTIIGLQFGTLLGGAVLTETVFAWPGIGRLLIDAISFRDYPVIQGTVLFIAVGFVLVNLLVDVMYAYLDPRIRYN